MDEEAPVSENTEAAVVSHPTIENIFTYHAPGPVERAKYEKIRAKAKELAYVLDECCAPGPDRTTAMRKLRECVMTANQSIATGNAQYR